MNKKVLILSSSPLKHDGITRLIFNIIDHNQNCFDFEIAAPKNSDDNYRIDKKIYTIHELPHKKDLFSYFNSINKLTKNNKYDVVYIQGNSALMIIEVLATRLGCTSKIVTHCHSASSDYKIVHHIVKPVFNMLIDTKIGCSKIASNWAYIGKNIIIIPNGVDIKKYNFDERIRYVIRKQLQLKDDEVLIGNIGRFSKVKNQVFLLDVFSEYLKLNNNSKLLLIGKGEMKKEISNKIDILNLNNNVLLIEPVDDIEKYYNAMDVMVVPSLIEAFSLVSVEAQANGLPTIVSDTFPEEIFVTPLINKESLKNSSTDWANKINNCYNDNIRGIDVDYLIKEKGLDLETFNKLIIEALKN